MSTRPPFPQPSGPDAPVLMELTGVGDSPALRADAVRNRARLLEAASRFVEEHGVNCLTMEAVAKSAGVGKGTVFRRFGDRTGLLMALLDHSEQAFQARFLGGPPPVGPGAPPLERLHAFGRATLREAASRLELYLAAQPDAERRYANPPYQVRLTHVTMLVRQVAPDGDGELLAQALMAYLDPALIHHFLRQRAMPLERLEAGWSDLVDRCATAR
ncbi:TetR/AcrR family transcriptional regulator [Streptomyces sp. t39]|uniref:TetR/AcrR family transcriptional regulator n=1 Tax=Streptomyces sp. t39 TaxID=1828156 RepID=UPI0011CE3314|nr:TetR/AcrR family transcriptional regulator [Streptomyces sp. t39]TXS49192.1 TetR/AcrR family transcriptional regulator [Streptomyces sp. t39]